MELLSSLNEMSASEGFPIVLLGALQAIGALGLIIEVLLIIDKLYKKNHPQNTDDNETELNNSDNDTGDIE